VNSKLRLLRNIAAVILGNFILAAGVSPLRRWGISPSADGDKSSAARLAKNLLKKVLGTPKLF